MYNFQKTGFIYITGKIGSFISFLLSNINRKTLIFYETEDEALLFKEEIEFFSKRTVYLFPIYANRVKKKMR
jgi:hypothetical protein